MSRIDDVGRPYTYLLHIQFGSGRNTSSLLCKSGQDCNSYLEQ